MKQKLFKYFLPAAMVAGFLCFFFYDALHYIANIDDSFNDEYVSKMGAVDAAKLFFSNINGRWFSHIITAVGFHFLKNNYTHYAFYVTGMMLLFVAAVSVLHKVYLKTFLSQEVSVFKSMLFAFVFTATLYFLLFVGRQEIWAWVSSANNHLLSVIFCVLLFSLLLQENKSVFKTITIFLLAAAIGGLNEVNASCCVLSVVGLFFLQKIYYPQLKVSKTNMIMTVLIIVASLSINTFSGGYESRMNGLPNFTLPQSIKNTVHTFALPVMQYKLLVLRLFALLTFLFFIDTNFSKLKLNRNDKIITCAVLAIVAVSFFLHCYILSDIVPARGEVWGYTLVLFVLYAFVTKKNKSTN
ncbi:MAG TPA: hypothetical protein VK835_00980 [Bacteroidia bacterium]|nr:hypothetical protein [Bacteroidia bacterium]